MKLSSAPKGILLLALGLCGACALATGGCKGDAELSKSDVSRLKEGPPKEMPEQAKKMFEEANKAGKGGPPPGAGGPPPGAQGGGK